MSETWLVGAALLAPLGGVAGTLAARHRPNWRETASLLAAAVAFCSLATAIPLVAAGGRPSLSLLEPLPGLSIAFALEPLGLTFALLAALLWFVTVIYALGYMRAHGEPAHTRFFAFFAVSIGAAIGGALAANLLTLYLFYELLTLVTYPLVTYGGKDQDRRGGRTYLRVLFGTSLLFLLTAIVWTGSLTGSLDFVDGGHFMADGELIEGVGPALLAMLYALFLFGTGKAALMPFHRWLPAAMVAPTPVSALLHAVAVVKLGVFAILKVSLYIFGLDALSLYDAGRMMQYVAAATLLIAGIIALREDNIKRRLAYSTVSQLGYIVLAAALANGAAVFAGSFHMLAHAFSKITLFFCAGIFLITLHKTRVSELAGIGRRMPLTCTAWLIASMGVIGLPLTGGFWSKWYLAQGTIQAGEPLLLFAILAGSLLAMGYLLPPGIRAFTATPEGTEAPALKTEGPRAAIGAMLITALLSVLLFFFVGLLHALLTTAGT